MNEPQAGSQASNGAENSEQIVVQVFGRTDVGLVREHNEDNFLVADLTRGNRSIKPEVRSHGVGDKGSLFVVCDGMGGAAAGEVASRIAVDTIYEEMQAGNAAGTDEELARKLDRAICEAGMRIYTAARLDRGRRGMGTTVTAAVLNSERLLIGQVGDSRAHVIRDGRLVQVTKDQSLVQQLIDAKQLTDDEAKNFERSNIILQALGTAEDVHVDMTQVELRKGDLLVMCSDGLSGLVDQERILEVALSTDDLVEACRLLTDAACEGGGDDNITVLMARFDGDGLILPSAKDKLEYDKFFLMDDTEDHASKSILSEEDLDDDDTASSDQADENPESSTAEDGTQSNGTGLEHTTAEVSETDDDSARPTSHSRTQDAPQRRFLVGGAFVLVFVALALTIWLVTDRQPEASGLPNQLPPAVPTVVPKTTKENKPPPVAPPVEEKVPSLSLDNHAFKKVAPKPKRTKKAQPATPKAVELAVPAREDDKKLAPEDKQPDAEAEEIPEDSALEDAPNLILPILPEPLEQEEPDEPAAKSGGEKKRKKKPSGSPSEPLGHQQLDENPF